MLHLLTAMTLMTPQTPAPAPSPRPDRGLPSLEIAAAPGEIRIDGRLDDEGWAGAARATDFTEFAPDEGAEPPVATEVLVTYDRNRIYLGFIAHGDPAKIRASISERDAIFGDDFVGVLIDTFGDEAWAYLLFANPYGIQADSRRTPGNEDVSFDILYFSEGRITQAGYVVEMAIPFASLRFPEAPLQQWRINFYRNLPRASRHQIAWAPLTRDNSCLLCQSGLLTGIQGVRAGGRLELLPSIVASRAAAAPASAEPGSSLRAADPRMEASLGVRYAFASGWTVEGTFNPDFSQIAADAARIDVNTTFALFYPERRPFFQEGSDLFATYYNTVYTRSINDPIVAAKVTGRLGEISVAYIGARDEHSPYVLPFEERSAILHAGESTSNIVRVRKNLSDDSYVGVLLTDRRMEGTGSGTTFGLDGMIRFADNYIFEAQVVGSYTVEPTDPALTEALGDLAFGYGDDVYTAAFDGESFPGRATYLSLERLAELWSFDLEYFGVTPSYRAANGFQTRNDYRRAIAVTWLNFYPDLAGVDQITPELEFGRSWNFGGVTKSTWIEAGVRSRVIGQTMVRISGEFGSERFRGVEFDDMRGISFGLNSDFSEMLSLGTSVSYGSTIRRTSASPRIGSGTTISASADFQPTPRLAIQPSYSYATLVLDETGERVYAGYIARTRVGYQFSRELSLRVIAQYDDFGGRFEIDPLLTYQLDPYSVFYLGSTHDFGRFDGPAGLAATDRQIFLKFQYLFRG